MLLYSLFASFENFRCVIESRDTLSTPDVLRAKVIEKSDARNDKMRSDESNAMFVKRSSARSDQRENRKWNRIKNQSATSKGE